MIAGGHDSNGNVGTTETLDALNLAAGWVPSASMTPRVNHNLVIMPDGKVLAVGGESDAAQTNLYPVKKPQIWDPNGNQGQGTWTALGDLAEQASIRGYHSTAILLPDGRVLSASGEALPSDQPAYSDKHTAELFCPPYLFNSSGGLATRPAISAAGSPLSLPWGKVFTVCLTDTTYISRVCLIRPGAATHAFDQNQRYVPLSFVKAGNPQRLLVTSPASPDSAPPGYYMLFLTGSADGSDVPSIARWVQLRSNPGRDTCDSVAPGTNTDLSFDVGTTSVVCSWSSSADDAVLAASGNEQSEDLRYSPGVINSESAWGIASTGTHIDNPGPVGTPQTFTVQNLSTCTTYHFAVRATDDNIRLSALPADFHVKTLGSGCGGGAAAREVGGGGSFAARSASLRSTASPSAVLTSNAGATVVETSSDASGAWHIVARQLAGASDVGLADSAGVFVQLRNSDNTWRTVMALTNGEDNIFALGTLRNGRRMVLAGGFQLQQVAASFRCRSTDYVLAGAMQGSIGDLGQTFVAAGGPVSLSAGDSLVLIYQPSALALTDPASWFAVVNRATATSASVRPQLGPEASTPVHFALHQNEPNPFSARTAIRFDLPVGAIVRLEVFDAGGRRIETLANHYFGAGHQSVTWDPRARRNGPGIYFYRIEAGPFRARMTAVLVP
jgi:hypothetical protein